MIKVNKLNDVHLQLDCEPHIGKELSEHFSFYVPGYRFMPTYKNQFWDGKIRLYNQMAQTIYCGLKWEVVKFARKRGYQVEFNYDDSLDQFSVVEAKEFADTLTLPHTPRDYQLEAFAHAMRYKRALLLSPTASGKSLIIYLIAKMMQRVLIVVPTTSLVHQMRSDFKQYGSDDTQIIMAGQQKDIHAHTTISTWQSIYKQPRSWFDTFDCVIGDEAHLFKAKSLTTMMEKFRQCEYKFGMTGTLDNTQTHKMVLEGLFGATKRVTTTKQLIDQKHLAEFKIKCLLLQYTEPEKRVHNNDKYKEEIDFIISNNKRNKFISNLAISLKGNTLLLYQFVDKHGKVLRDIIKTKSGNRKVFFVYGGTDGEIRDQIRGIVEREKDSIIIASFGTFSTGINIQNLHNIIFASPSKSRIRNLQSIGRGLRKGSNKYNAVLYDIADDLKIGKKYNHTLKHFAARLKMYDEESFEYKLYKVKL